MDSKKRKREEDVPTVITFHAPTKTFDRVFKEKSLEETKNAVSKKLGLAHDAHFRLVQLRGGVRVDLEDDDDFEAFSALARSNTTLDVLVSLGDSQEVPVPPVDARSQPSRLQSVLSISASGPGKKRRKKLRHGEEVLSQISLGPTAGPSSYQHARTVTPPNDVEQSSVAAIPQKGGPDARVRESRSRSTAQSVESVAGPSNITNVTATIVPRGSIPVSQEDTAQSTADGGEETPARPGRRKKKGVEDAYANAENANHTLDLDSVPPDETLSLAKKSKKRKLQSSDNGEPIPEPTPADDREKPWKTKKRKVEILSQPVNESTPPRDTATIGDNHKSTKRGGRRARETTTRDTATPSSSVLESPAGSSSHQARARNSKTKSKGVIRDEEIATEETPAHTAAPEPAEADAGPARRKSKKTQKSQDEELQRSSPVEEAVSGVLEPSGSIPNSEASQMDVTAQKKHKIRVAAPPEYVNETSSAAEQAIEASFELSKRKTVKKKKGSETVLDTVVPNADAPESSGITQPDVVFAEAAIDAIHQVPSEDSSAALRTEGKAEATRKRVSKRKPAASIPAVVPSDIQGIETLEPTDSEPQEQIAQGEKGKGKTYKTKKPDVVATDAVARASSQASAARTKKGAKVEAPKPVLSNGDVMAAVAAVLARRGFASSPSSILQNPSVPSSSEPTTPATASNEAVPDSTIPANTSSQSVGRSASTKTSRKGKVMKSKLQQAWTPDDLELEPTPHAPSVRTDAASFATRPTVAKSGSKAKTAPKQQEQQQPGEPPSNQAAESEAQEILNPAPPSPDRSVSSPRLHDVAVEVAREISPEIPMPSSPPAIPVGTEIDEVLVQGKDEGSSSESESEDEEDDSGEDIVVPEETVMPSALPTQTELDEESMEALLRGPVRKRSLLEALASESSTEEEESEPEDSPLASDEEERNERAFRRMSRQFERDELSSDEEMPDTDVDDASTPGHAELYQGEAANDEATDEPSMMVGDARISDASSSPDSDSHEAVMAAEPQLQQDRPPSVVSLLKHPPQSDAPGEEVAENHPVDEDLRMSPAPSAVSVHDPQVSVTANVIDPSPNQISLEPVCPEEPGETPVPDAKTDVEPVAGGPDAHDHIMTPEPDFSASAPLRSREDSADPIEPADELVLIPSPSKEADPIEVEPTSPVAVGRVMPPPPSLSRTSTTKRMKDRYGNVPASSPMPVSASDNQPVPQALSAELTERVEQEGEDGVPPSTPTPTGRGAQTKRKSARGQDADTTIQSLSKPIQPKPRGRPRLTAEERAQRAAEKQAEKEKKAAEKKAEKEKKAAEREKKAAEKEIQKQEKARLRAEKAKNTKGTKAQPTQGAEPNVERSEMASTSSMSQVESILAATPEVDTPTVEPPPSNHPSQPQVNGLLQAAVDVINTTAPVTRHKPRLSQVLWATIPQTPDTPAAEESMFDELRSSSPVQPLHPNHANGAPRLDDGRATEAENETQTPHGQGNKSGESLELEHSMATPTPKTNGKDASPLFFPSNSQYPDSQPALQALVAQSSPARSDSASGSDDEDGLGRFKKPMKPASHWGGLATFRRLSDLASQQMFPPTPVTSTPVQQQTAEERRRSLYDTLGGNEDDSESSSDSDADKSHIPKGRRAGVRPRTSGII